MIAEIKALQWNIGGGMIREAEADPSEPTSYVQEGLETIIDFLEGQDADIVTLQETHENGSHSQTAAIAEALGYNWVSDRYDNSHLDEGFMLGQGILSRFPIDGHSFRLFTNPGYTAVMNGERVRCHDKGISSAVVGLGKGTVLMAQTLHAVPFRRFGVDVVGNEADDVLEDMETKILERAQIPGVLQGDFNINLPSLLRLFPRLVEAGFEEVEQPQPTTPRGRRYDHVLFGGMDASDSRVFTDQLTDHYPLVTQFALR